MNDIRVAQEIIKSSQQKREERNQRNFEEKHIPVDIKMNDVVYCWEGKGFKSGKMKARWSGPWTVVGISEDRVGYELTMEGRERRRRTADHLIKDVETLPLVDP